MTPYILYARKSSESEERQVLSIESQIKEVKLLAQRLNIEVAEILTESQSAKLPGRPIFDSLMMRIQKGEFKGILVWKLDRLARNPIDGSAIVWALDQGKISEITTPHGTFNNNSSDKFLMQIEFGIAKKYVDDLSDNVKRGNRAKLERGWLPGLAPLGYLNEPRERTIIKDPERFLQVRRMWDLLINGERVSEIVRIANDEWGFRMRMFRKVTREKLNVNSLYKTFNNTFYYGLITRPEGVFQGKHEPMITEDEYWKAQKSLGKHGKQRPVKHKFAFTGLIRCGECGAMITAEEHTNRYGYHYTYYRCTRKRGRCTQKYINGTQLDEHILDILNTISIPRRLFDLALRVLQETHRTEVEKGAIDKTTAAKALDNCKRKLDNLNQMRMRDLINDEEYMIEKKALMKEKIDLEGCLSRAYNREEIVFKQVETAFVFANTALERFKNGSLEDKRMVLQNIGSNFLLKDKILSIELEKPFADIKKGLTFLNAKSGWLELLENGSAKEQTIANSCNYNLVCTLVKDVRTFYENALMEPRDHESSIEQ